ncbi:hypothetical protein IFM12275_00460 [Nocardia sputorum]|uniref:hypothetical protein n=1 Tax=Nocardia sputorum TaxID=2984338 RepID=UPI002493A141|nr:hypothetical protein [Nocardia sputorum]BDT90070.1 hypothetical protein IFM12275_00460 [Nocardia sputorum]
MFSVAVLVPSPPVLVPELCGGVADEAGTGDPDPRVVLRSAVLDAVRAVAAAADHWTVIGVGADERTFGPETVGTFRGFGADVRVGLSGAAVTGTGRADADLPLAVLIGGWLRGQVAPGAIAEARVVPADATPEHCREAGAKTRAVLDGDVAPRGVLVVADGAATLSTTAPGYLDERARPAQDRLDHALSTGDRAALWALDPGLCGELGIAGRAAYQVLAGLFRADPLVETRYRDAPFGVGYHVSLWRPAGDDAP